MKGVKEVVSLLVLTAVVAGRPPACPKPGSAAPRYLPDEGDRSSFWQCSQGAAFHMRCHRGLVWNKALSVCDWPSAVEADDHHSRHRADAAAGSWRGFSQEPSSHSTTRKDNGDLEESQTKRSFKTIVHELLHLYDMLQDGPEFDLRHTKRPVEDHEHNRRPVDDSGHSRTPVENSENIKRLVEDLENTRKLLEDLTDTKRPVKDLELQNREEEDDGQTKRRVEDDGHSKRAMEDFESTKILQEYFRDTERLIENFGHIRRKDEDLEHTESPVEDHENTKRRGHRKSPMEELGHIKSMLDDLRHTKRPVKHHVDHAQIMKSIFRLTD